MILDAGCGYLSDHKRRDGIGIDLQRGTCDIIGDLHHLPFRNNVFNFIYARNVLEHLDHPIQALHELKRVMKTGAKISITIPCHHNPCKDEVLKYLAGFPFRMSHSLIRIKRWRKNKHHLGSRHKNRIEAKHISKVFMVLRFEMLYPLHPLNRVLKKVKPTRILIKLLFGSKYMIRYPFPDNVYIYAMKVK